MAAGLLRNLALVALLVALTNASVILEEEETIVDKTKAYWDNNKDELMAHTGKPTWLSFGLTPVTQLSLLSSIEMNAKL